MTNPSVVWLPYMAETVDHFRLYSQAELSSVQPNVWAVKGIIPLPSVGVIFGPPKAFKTFVAIDLGAHLANGIERWFGFRVKQSCEVIYVPLEGRGSMKPRSDAWCLQHGRPSTGIHYLLDGVNLQAEDQVDNLIGQILRYHQHGSWKRPVFVIIDTLAQAAAGLDENGSDMSTVLAAGQRIAARTGGAVCFVAHPGHGNAERVRGWSGLPAGFDFSFRIEVHGKSERTLVVDKVKDGEDGQRIDFCSVTRQLGFDEDSEAVSSLVVLPRVQFGDGSAKPVRLKAAHDEEERAVLAWIKEKLAENQRSSGNSVEGFREQIVPGMSQARMRDCIKRLCGRGALHKEGAGKDAWLRPIDLPGS
jgi:hypothetical protein